MSEPNTPAVSDAPTPHIPELPDLPGESVTTAVLHVAVTDLVRSVQALDATLKSDYPTRIEVKKRRVQVVLGVLVAIMSSYFFTIGTISYCFLGGIPEEGQKFACNVFPGYSDSFDNNRQFVLEFQKLQKEILDNRVRIVQLESAK